MNFPPPEFLPMPDPRGWPFAPPDTANFDPGPPVVAPPVSLPAPSGASAWAESLGLALAQNPLQYQRRRGASGFEDFLGSLLASAGNTYGGGVARDVGQRESFNERSRVAAAERNREAVANSRQAERERIERLQKVSDSARTLRERRAEREAERAAQAERDARLHANDLERDRLKPNGGGTGYAASQDDVEQVADGMAAGELPPTTAVGFRDKTRLMAALRRRGYDLTKAMLDFDATKRYYATQDGSIQVRLRQALENASGSVDIAEQLNEQLIGKVPRTRSAFINRPLLVLAREAGNSEVAGLVTQLQGQVAALQSELANVYQGGGVPTDDARKQAYKIINPDMSPTNLRAAIALARRDISVRRMAMATAGVVSPSNPLTAEPQTQVNIGGRVIPVAGEPAGDGLVRMIAPDGRVLRVPEKDVKRMEGLGAVRR